MPCRRKTANESHDQSESESIRATPGVNVRPKTTSLKVTWILRSGGHAVERQHKQNSHASSQQRQQKDSSTNEVKMLGRENPITRSVAISRQRYATAAYMVFIAAKIEPIAMMLATTMPINLMTRRSWFACRSTRSPSAFEFQPLIVGDSLNQRVGGNSVGRAQICR